MKASQGYSLFEVLISFVGVLGFAFVIFKSELKSLVYIEQAYLMREASAYLAELSFDIRHGLPLPKINLPVQFSIIHLDHQIDLTWRSQEPVWHCHHSLKAGFSCMSEAL